MLYFAWCRVHLKIDEKIVLTAGRDGGLQNMEVRGLMLLRISEAEYGRITIAVDNDDKLGFQMQVGRRGLVATHPLIC